MSVRFVPDWMPGAGFKRVPPGTREDMETFLNTPFEQVKKQMVSRTSRPTFTTAVFIIPVPNRLMELL